MDDAPTIPRYRILRVLGEGGMGVVYEAEQLEPVRRRVALKLLKIGLDTKAFVGRFHAERQALAMLEHPNIARVYDAGSTPEGRPYYTMEYVPGLPLTEFCDSRHLETRARIELMVQVCEGVQHAHDHGIIHRDLKPSNILVAEPGDRPVPKIIDFGIAKALTGRLSDHTFATQFHQPIGTAAYMSPEQWEAGQIDLDIRTDVYSLGVMLYELLVGVLPYDPEPLRRVGPVASVLMRDTPPPTPSHRFSGLKESAAQLARLRETDARAHARHLRGDLDRIALKALEPDRTRRYESARALAEDLGRHLRFEPVLARAPSLRYRTGRLLRRRRFTVLAVTAAMLFLAAAALFAARAAEIRVQKYRAEMRSSLRNLVIAEEVFYAEHRQYTGAIADLDYEPSADVTVEMYAAGNEGWTAVATHRKLPGLRCAIVVGQETALAGEGEPVCTAR